ncbi:MAG: LacI family DNA-binding transcriptional regulator [Rhizobiaceae bacterium]
MVNQKQIARELGISVATVSNALTGKGRVSADVIRLVTTRAEELEYFPSAAGRALKTGRSGILGLVIPDITHPVFPDFAHGVETEAEKCGYGILISDSRGTEAGQKSAIEQLIQRGVDGIIIVPTRSSNPSTSKVPTAIVSTPNDPKSNVAANHRQGGRLSAQALFDLGHRSFLLVGEDPMSPVQKERIDGMKDILTGAAKFEICWANEKFPDLVLKHQEGITACLAVSDMLALRIITEAGRSGVRCPDALSVIGFDNLPLGTAVRPTLSTIIPDTAELARRAVGHLNSAIQQDGEQPSSSVVEMGIILRESTQQLTQSTQ